MLMPYLGAMVRPITRDKIMPNDKITLTRVLRGLNAICETLRDHQALLELIEDVAFRIVDQSPENEKAELIQEFAWCRFD